MIPESHHPMFRSVWPHLDESGRRHRVPAELLAGLAWVRSGYGPKAMSPDGAQGLMQIMPAAAAEIARERGIDRWCLYDPATAADFAAFDLAVQLERFTLPRVALAACCTSPNPAARARGEIPPDPAVERYVRDVLAAWAWLRDHAEAVLSRPDEAPSKRWRLDVPSRGDQAPLTLPRSALPLVEALAERLGLALHRDDRVRKVYLDLPPTPLPRNKPKPRAFVAPVPGAGKTDVFTYPSADGLDVLVGAGTPVVAAADGVVVHACTDPAARHAPPDTRGRVLIRLDRAYGYRGKPHPYLSYHHLSRLRSGLAAGAAGTRVAQGELIGWSGVAGRIPLVRVRIALDETGTSFVPPEQLAACFGWL